MRLLLKLLYLPHSFLIRMSLVHCEEFYQNVYCQPFGPDSFAALPVNAKAADESLSNFKFRTATILIYQ